MSEDIYVGIMSHDIQFIKPSKLQVPKKLFYPSHIFLRPYTLSGTQQCQSLKKIYTIQ